jgi:hypothetical protein
MVFVLQHQAVPVIRQRVRCRTREIQAVQHSLADIHHPIEPLVVRFDRGFGRVSQQRRFLDVNDAFQYGENGHDLGTRSLLHLIIAECAHQQNGAGPSLCQSLGHGSTRESS